MSNYSFNLFENDGSIKLEWVSEKARNFAESLDTAIFQDVNRKLYKVSRNEKGKFFKKNKDDKLVEDALSSNQLRNFYNEFLRIRDLPSDDKTKIVQIKLLEAKVKYKKTNSPKEMKQIFVDFITALVNQIGDSIEKFNNSCLIMEAIVGFFPKKK